MPRICRFTVGLDAPCGVLTWECPIAKWDVGLCEESKEQVSLLRSEQVLSCMQNPMISFMELEEVDWSGRSTGEKLRFGRGRGGRREEPPFSPGKLVKGVAMKKLSGRVEPDLF
ncbi:hypothetical protein Tco_0887614 [Tanacetum coccineum]